MASDPPEWAYEDVRVCDHDPRWAPRAARERERLVELLGPWLVDGVEHVGSTAVPGLAAKPVLDLMASVSSPETVLRHAALAGDGWVLVPPELDEREWRRFLVKPDASGRCRYAHLHLITAGHPRWRQQIAFRDALRSDPALSREYAQLKRRLARTHSGDRERYTAGKSEFVRRVLHD
ncbi:GrpB-like predicted nucleotidyltransferase (UPF0157 family) [Haloactinospora alba]|uniref:GrpB-like predicted nucleotidyltransferase (UPF0157 family) n=1 Tax=Haloactinospora alba TaxID=405555 RepID=A0A543NAJ8_9ACTN|nr:GrpB family protein [Haloactinospora alba]TQN28816.1 GrpB-like predicted nucleotidyltransferase (UPF0157 family) [Haloactinospora alba]